MGNTMWRTDDAEIEFMCSDSVYCMILVKPCCVTRMINWKV